MTQETLTPDAIAVAGATFGFMLADGKTERLRFALIDVQPTARMQAALDSLEENGYVKKYALGYGPGYYYVLLKSCEHFRKRVAGLTKKHGPIKVVEPIMKDK
jgi:hypothetical protein